MNSAAVYPPLAPPANMPGYEGMGQGAGGFLPPPMPMQPIAPPQPVPEPEDWQIPSLSEDAARQAFKDYAGSKCCYSEGPAKDGVITQMEPLNTYRYRLETYVESRSTEWAHKPHNGEVGDFYTQTAPQPWEVQATPPNLFANGKELIRVPYTSTVKDCHDCNGAGNKACDNCHGSGYKTCSLCKGSGSHNEGGCIRCDSTGKDKCSECDARGSKKCETCEGKCRLLSFIQLTVEWTNHVEDHMVEQDCALTKKDLSSVSGKELFKDSHYLVYPLLGFPNPAICQASERLVREHQSKYGQTSRILQQRQTVELIPITRVGYKWKGDSHVYFVYGNEQLVSSDYPATCCCVIL
ncbi:protein SSUH2 homolog [Nerophis ophidion]|uniref:protein SSUH2 homolog n=1 Tax=Nerophis ophidion TaxID=159077 RepID=UPI002ADF5165|nr:protein SSUH2 homolog [Nerophis ophidion]